MSKERDILRSLLLREELERLDNLEKKVMPDDQFTQEVSNILSEAVNRSQLKDKSLEIALSKPIKKGVVKVFATNKQAIADSLLPIMGQLIRKTVTNSMKQFVSDINRTLELNLSIKSIRWRMQAKKAGISYAEMVFQKTISYKVQELFVINKDNGLLIHHVGENETLVDKNAISGMLTVIQDFISDSVKTTEKGLFSASIGDASYLIASGSKAYLATVVKGSATERLKQRSQELITDIHADFSDLLVDDSRYQNDEEFDDYLRNHLISKSITKDKKKKINWVPWIILIALILSGLYYWSNMRSQQLHQVNQLIESTPGFILQNIERDNGGFIVSGLLDPIADPSKLQIEKITLNTQPFISLDKEIIQKRVSLVTKNYKNINVNIINNKATITGSIPNKELNVFLQKINNIIGIDIIINQLKIDYSHDINAFFQQHPDVSKKINYSLKDDSIFLSGKIDKENFDKFHQKLKRIIPKIIINTEKLTIIDTIDTIKEFINETKLNVPKLSNQNTIEERKLLSVIQNIKTLIKNNKLNKINIIGESDCTGQNSDRYSQIRADNIKQIFIISEINLDYINTSIKTCNKFNSNQNIDNLNVSFNVL